MGSLTTFSSWHAESSIKFWVNQFGIDGIFAILVGFSTSYISLLFGQQIGAAIKACQSPSGEGEEIAGELRDDPADYRDRALTSTNWIAAVFLGLLFVILSVVLSESPFRSIPLACLGVAPGAVLRYAVSFRLNSVRPNFPIGTFVCNVIGTVFYLIVVIALRVNQPSLCVTPSPRSAIFGNRSSSPSVSQCPIPSSSIGIVSSVLLLGFAGGFTTVSTFVLELHSSSAGAGWTYGIATILVTQLLLLPFNAFYQRTAP